MFIPVWLVAVIIFAAAFIVTPFLFKSQGDYDFGAPIMIGLLWLLEIICFLSFWIILL
jgi:hypothetical protein